MPNDLTVASIILPNEDDEHGDYWNPWVALGIGCGGYRGDGDQNALAVLRGINVHLYSTDIAERTGLASSHVELLQEIFCSANWCEYGTSPRGCWPIDREGFPLLIEAWEQYYERHWSEPVPAPPRSSLTPLGE